MQNSGIRRSVGVAALALALIACSKAPPAPVANKNTFGPWTVTSTRFGQGKEPFLTNGLVGIRFDLKGNPVRSYQLLGYQQEGEEKIIENLMRPMSSDSSGMVTESRITQDLHRGTLVFEGKEDGQAFKRMVWMHPDSPDFEIVEDNAERQAWSATLGPNGQSSFVPVERNGQYPSEVWSKFWNVDIEIDGPEMDQFMIRSFLFHLRTAVHPKSTRAIAPFGLSSSTYFGHIFWDADLWVFPALCLLDPERAGTISKYRLSTFKQAQENYLSWVKSGRKVANGVLSKTTGPMSGAAMFPWESSVSGKETVPGPSRFEHHISPTVAFSLWKAAQLGLISKSDAIEVGTAVSKFLIDRTIIKNGLRHFPSTMSPDEYHNGDDDLYTNLVSEWCLNTYPVPELDQGVRKFYRPKKDGLLLNYENDAMRAYKQAAGVLAAFPLQDPEAEAQGLRMLEAYADKVIPHGPAMSECVHAILFARNAKPDLAYRDWKRTWDHLVDVPHVQFCEKANLKDSIFYTGLAGSLQTVLYGFAGIRLDKKPLPGASFTKRLSSDLYFSVQPCLPPTWKSLKLKGLHLLGKQYDLVIQSAKDGASTVRLDAHKPSLVN